MMMLAMDADAEEILQKQEPNVWAAVDTKYQNYPQLLETIFQKLFFTPYPLDFTP